MEERWQGQKDVHSTSQLDVDQPTEAGIQGQDVQSPTWTLQDVLKIDTVDLEVTVEPNVTSGLLNRLLVFKGVTFAVVPELDSLTIGGLLMGGGIESTSHKHGFHWLLRLNL